MRCYTTHHSVFLQEANRQYQYYQANLANISRIAPLVKHYGVVSHKMSMREGALAAQARVSSNRRRHDPDDETDVSVSHIFPCFIKHRVWKRQPRGGSIGVGTVPSRIILFFPSLASTVGTADSKALV